MRALITKQTKQTKNHQIKQFLNHKKQELKTFNKFFSIIYKMQQNTSIQNLKKKTNK